MKWFCGEYLSEEFEKNSMRAILWKVTNFTLYNSNTKQTKSYIMISITSLILKYQLLAFCKFRYSGQCSTVCSQAVVAI